jgi:hypothetical protein
MVNKIEFSRHSLAELGEILTYLQQNASEQAVIRFYDLVKNNFTNSDRISWKGVLYLHSKRFVLFALGNITECITVKMVEPFMLLPFLIHVKTLINALTNLKY